MGACSEKLYQHSTNYNIYNPDFKLQFKPDIKPVICSKQECICQPEINTRKSKIIPIRQV